MPLWWAGWRPKHMVLGVTAVAGFIGVQIDMWFTLGFLGIFAGIGLWYAGTKHINEEYEGVLKAYLDEANNHAREILRFQGEDVEIFTLRYASGSSFLVKPNEEYRPTTLAVAESSVAVYDDTELDMVDVNPRLGTNTQEFYYDQISTVQFEEPFLEIKTSDGDTLQYRSSREPDDALHELQAKLRNYKAAKV